MFILGDLFLRLVRTIVYHLAEAAMHCLGHLTVAALSNFRASAAYGFRWFRIEVWRVCWGCFLFRLIWEGLRSMLLKFLLFLVARASFLYFFSISRGANSRRKVWSSLNVLNGKFVSWSGKISFTPRSTGRFLCVLGLKVLISLSSSINITCLHIFSTGLFMNGSHCVQKSIIF